MIRLAVRAPTEAAERVLAAVLELAPSGVEQVEGEGFVEYAVYGSPGELPELALGEAEVGGVLVTVSGTEVPDDWAERWKRFHSPVLVGGRLWVRPPWEEPAGRPGVIDLVIDPGRAFGTGAHPTTRLCLELLLDLDLKGRSFCDLGCGSGVLSIAAAKLGAEPVVALDSDRLAVDATLANARDNGVALEQVRRANLRSEAPPRADVMAANLMRPLLMRVAELMEEPPRALIVSGLLEHEADEAAEAFAPMVEQRRLASRGWATVTIVGELPDSKRPSVAGRPLEEAEITESFDRLDAALEREGRQQCRYTTRR
ncbi:MAG TPA: 50S ribosomal protein L11 methyltransferase [Thermoleophilaceae bacterium]|nr:50S ribosomal protein L11 methyltransferase [Thermoleophilaceae bacterium]